MRWIGQRLARPGVLLHALPPVASPGCLKRCSVHPCRECLETWTFEYADLAGQGKGSRLSLYPQLRIFRQWFSIS